MPVKICRTCLTEKPTSEFNKAGNYLQSSCRDCTRAYFKTYYHEHKERLRDSTKRWVSENKAKATLMWAEYYKAHRDNYRDYHDRWIEENPERFQAIERKRQYRRRASLEDAGVFNAETWEGLCASFSYLCVACYEPRPLTVDHIVPLSRGGTNHVDNLQPLCRSCNSRKGTNTMNYRGWFMVA